MIKHLIVVVASAVLGVACGLPGLDALESGEADVEIVNADAAESDTSDLGSAALGDADSEADGSVSDAGKDTAGDGGENTDDDGTTDGGEQTIVATGGDIIETASGAAISLVGTEDRMTTAPDRPTRGWGYLTVDRAFSTAEHEDNTATAGSKFVVVEYQLLVGEDGNFFEQAFRLLADGEIYSPLNSINSIGSPASVVNDRLVFEVPLAAQVLQLEGGVPSGSADGFTALYDIDLAPASGTETAEAPLTDAEVEAIIGDIQASAETAMTIDTGEPEGGFGNLTVDGGRATAKIEDTSAGPDHKFLIVDFQLLGVERDNFFDHALRIETEGEWYGSIVSFNEILTAGEVYNGSVIFRVPRSATDFVLEGGMPERWADGLRTTVSFSLWDPAEGIEADEPNDSAEVAIEAEATDVSLIGDEDRMTIDPELPRGFGRLTIDRVYTTAKIEQDGAKEGFKFLLVDYQLLGIERDNFFDEAFRLEAGGELYSPLNNINEIIAAGEVYNGTLVFEVPAGTTMARLESGVIAGATDGYTANHQIIFG